MILPIGVYLFMGLLLGGSIGVVAGQKSNPALIGIEPDLWGPSAHKDFMKACGSQCRKTKGQFKSYDPTTGECRCQLAAR